MERRVQVQLCARLCGIVLFGLCVRPALYYGLQVGITDWFAGSGGAFRVDAAGRTLLGQIVHSQIFKQACVRLLPHWVPLILGAWITINGSKTLERLIEKELSRA
jgi:hypothetical protein